MSTSTTASLLRHLGGMPILPGGLPFTRNSKYYFVDPARGSDNNSGEDLESPLKSITEAEDRCVANQHDVVFYIGGSSAQTDLAAALTWDKNYTHLIGLAAPTGIATRARIFQLSTLTGASPLLNITASGCIFSNFYIFQGVDDATSLINVQVTGGRNYFYRVHFAGGGHATQAINGGASVKLNSDSCEENLFEECTFGVDTIDAATGMMVLLFDGDAHRNEFRRCRFRIRAGSTSAGFVELLDNTAIDRDTIFDNCMFINNSTANDVASAFIIPASTGEPRTIILKDCIAYNITKWDNADESVVFGNMNAVTGADLSGVAVALQT